jgi:hypothetical protein
MGHDKRKKRNAWLAAWPALLILSILIIATAASAQHILGTESGIIQFVQGEAFVDNAPLSLLPGDYPQMENGQSLRTEQGRVELLLAPSIYLRLGEKSLLRMEQNQLDDAHVALEHGSALIEAVRPIKENRLRIHFFKGVVEINKAGLYRLDASSGELRTYGGEVSVVSGNRQLTIKRNKMVGLNGEFAATKFNGNIADPLLRWAARRSFDLFNATMETRKQLHWQHTALGWMCNSNFRMKFFSKQYLADLRNDPLEHANAKAKEAQINTQPVIRANE